MDHRVADHIEAIRWYELYGQSNTCEFPVGVVHVKLVPAYSG